RQPVRDLLEVLTAVGALEERSVLRIRRAADDRPRLPLAAPHPDVDDVRIRGIDLDVRRADTVADEQRVLPRLAAVRRLEDAALVARREGVAVRRDPHDVGIFRMDADGADLSRAVQPDEAPGLAA